METEGGESNATLTMANTRAKKSPSNGLPRISVPDVLGNSGREQATDQFVARMLAGLQEEEVRLQVVERINDIDDSDALIPGEAETFAQRRAAIADQARKITVAFPDSAERLGERGE